MLALSGKNCDKTLKLEESNTKVTQTTRDCGSVLGDIRTNDDGISYFEVTVIRNKGGVMIGWHTGHFPRGSKGAGMIPGSYAIDSYFGKKGSEGKWTSYARKFKTGAVIGCLFNGKTRSIQYSIDGELFEDAWEDVPEGTYRPIITLKHITSVSVNQGSEPFVHPPPCLTESSIAASDSDEADVSDTDTPTEQSTDIAPIPPRAVHHRSLDEIVTGPSQVLVS